MSSVGAYVSAAARSGTKQSKMLVGLRAAIGKTISLQKQGRHVLGAREYNGGGCFKSPQEAQTVLNQFDSGEAQYLGMTNNMIVVKSPNVIGYNNNPGAGFLAQETSVFYIKGQSSISVVPANPLWKP